MLGCYRDLSKHIALALRFSKHIYKDPAVLVIMKP